MRRRNEVTHEDRTRSNDGAKEETTSAETETERSESGQEEKSYQRVNIIIIVICRTQVQEATQDHSHHSA